MPLPLASSVTLPNPFLSHYFPFIQLVKFPLATSPSISFSIQRLLSILFLPFTPVCYISLPEFWDCSTVSRGLLHNHECGIWYYSHHSVSADLHWLALLGCLGVCLMTPWRPLGWLFRTYHANQKHHDLLQTYWNLCPRTFQDVWSPHCAVLMDIYDLVLLFLTDFSLYLEHMDV